MCETYDLQYLVNDVKFWERSSFGIDHSQLIHQVCQGEIETTFVTMFNKKLRKSFDLKESKFNL